MLWWISLRFHFHSSLIPSKVTERVNTKYFITSPIQTSIVLPEKACVWMGSSTFSPASEEWSFSLGPLDQPSLIPLKKNIGKRTSLLNETSLPLREEGCEMCEWSKWLLWMSVLTALGFLKCSLVRLYFESSFTVVSAQILTSSLCLLAFPQRPRVFLGNFTLFTLPVFMLH